MSVPAWDTSARGEGADMPPGDLFTLGQHRAQCTARSVRLAALRCGLGDVMGFVSARLVTSAALLLAVAVLWWTWV